jgi:hypothetical protein
MPSPVRYGGSAWVGQLIAAFVIGRKITGAGDRVAGRVALDTIVPDTTIPLKILDGKIAISLTIPKYTTADVLPRRSDSGRMRTWNALRAASLEPTLACQKRQANMGHPASQDDTPGKDSLCGIGGVRGEAAN